MGMQVESLKQSSISRSLFIGDSRNGQIWKNLDWKKVMSGYLRSKTLLRIYDAAPPTPGSLLTHRTIAIGCICFSKEMAQVQTLEAQPSVSYAYVMALSDQRGHVYIFDFVKNKYWILARTGVSATYLLFNTIRRRELIVCLSDCTIHCYNIDTCVLIAKLPMYHHSPPTNLSIHPTKAIAMSTSPTESILWNTETWERVRVLTGSASGVQQANFSADGTCIVAAFRDGSIFFWTVDSFSLLWKISLDQLAGPSSETKNNINKQLNTQRTNYFAISESGEFFVYTGL
jgi:WD40 repeat protein